MSSKPFLCTGERVTFQVAANAASGGNRRKLRAVHVEGIDATGSSGLQIERAVLGLWTPPGGTLARRTGGVTRNFSTETYRGYIRPLESDASDAVVHVDAFVWDSAVPGTQRHIDEGVVVEYTVVFCEKNGKPVAGLVTGPGGEPLNPDKWVVSSEKQKRMATRKRERDRENAPRLIDTDDGAYGAW